ncbi:MAG: hypothetical protein RPV21_15505 [Candidatus Sedimenticola sp. (ex Thyasira tokunagai)]
MQHGDSLLPRVCTRVACQNANSVIMAMKSAMPTVSISENMNRAASTSSITNRAMRPPDAWGQVEMAAADLFVIKTPGRGLW